MTFTQMNHLIDTHKDELFALLGNLIRINSESFGSTGNEQPCAEHVRDLCLELGLETTMYSPLDLEGFAEHADYFPGRNLENRYNVTGIWKGAEDCNRLMLMAHLDTVEIGNPASWDFPPLSGEIIDGKICGRGACDDKYALAAALFIIKLLKKSGFEPKKNLVFNAYCDEELGGSHGAMAAVMKDPCQTVVSMDGREQQIWHCASGGQVVTYRYKVRGTVDNSGITARALPLVMDLIDTFAQNRLNELEANPYYAGTIIPQTSLRYNEIRAGNNDMDKDIGYLCFTFYTDKTKEIIWKELEELNKTLAEALDPLGIDSLGFQGETRFFHYGACDPQSEAIRTLVDVSKEAADLDLLVCGSCLSDLSVILKYGAQDSFGFGCGRDFSIPGGAHQPNEFIECDALVQYTKAIAAYVLRLVG